MRVLRKGIWVDLQKDNARLKAEKEKREQEEKMLREIALNETDPIMLNCHRAIARSMGIII